MERSAKRGSESETGGKEHEEAIETMRRSFELRMDAQGRFFVGADPVEHPRVAALFRASMELNAAGLTIVRLGAQWTYLEIADQPYRASSARIDGAGALVCFLDDGREVIVDWKSLAEDERGVRGLAPAPSGALLGVRLRNAATMTAATGLLDTENEEAKNTQAP